MTAAKTPQTPEQPKKAAVATRKTAEKVEDTTVPTPEQIADVKARYRGQ